MGGSETRGEEDVCWTVEPQPTRFSCSATIISFPSSHGLAEHHPPNFSRSRTGPFYELPPTGSNGAPERGHYLWSTSQSDTTISESAFLVRPGLS
jgi:hypothetical protein